MRPIRFDCLTKTAQSWPFLEPRQDFLRLSPVAAGVSPAVEPGVSPGGTRAEYQRSVWTAEIRKTYQSSCGDRRAARCRPPRQARRLPLRALPGLSSMCARLPRLKPLAIPGNSLRRDFVAVAKRFMGDI